MVMTGQETDGKGESRRLRVTIAPDGAGGVRQRWESSKDGGASWKDQLALAYRQ